jgi:hypothetical protein
MKAREYLQDDGAFSRDTQSGPAQTRKITLPIGGLLQVSESTVSSGSIGDNLELWMPLFGLPIQCPDRVGGQSISPGSVCFYSEEIISELLEGVGVGLKLFWSGSPLQKRLALSST